jgi:hypothetical protein
VRRRGRRHVAVHGLDLQPAELLAAQLELIDHHVQRRDVGRRLRQQGAVVAAAGRDAQPRQPRRYLAGAAVGAFAVLDAPGQLARLHLGAPGCVPSRVPLAADVVQAALVQQQLAGAQRPGGGQVVWRQPGSCGALPCALTAHALVSAAAPGVGVQPRQAQPRLTRRWPAAPVAPWPTGRGRSAPRSTRRGAGGVAARIPAPGRSATLTRKRSRGRGGAATGPLS